MRTKIAKSPEGLIALGKAISAKHIADGTKSVLKDVDGIDDLGTMSDDAETQHNAGKTLLQQAETANQAREILLGQKGKLRSGTVRHVASASRLVLLGKFKGQEHLLAGWGYGVVDATSTTSNPVKAAAKAAKKVAKVSKIAAKAAAKVKSAA